MYFKSRRNYKKPSFEKKINYNKIFIRKIPLLERQELLNTY